METVFITRITAESEKELKQIDLEKIIQAVSDSGIKKIYVLANFEKENCKISNIPIMVIRDESPTSPVALNTALYRIKKDNPNIAAFLIVSQEVFLTKDSIIKLVQELEYDQTLLVVGYKLQTEENHLNNELNKFYANKNLIAYKVPWNTCALWNFKLFDEYVSKFDEITERNPFHTVGVTIDGSGYETEHKGMEDGLAIAQAITQSKGSIKYKLINKLVPWKVDKKRELQHRQKLARKDIVMRNFMAIRNYSVSDLIKAQQ